MMNDDDDDVGDDDEDDDDGDDDDDDVCDYFHGRGRAAAWKVTQTRPILTRAVQHRGQWRTHRSFCREVCMSRAALTRAVQHRGK